MSEFREKPENYGDTPKAKTRKKFATQMDERLLESLRAYSKSEGRQLQAVLEDAVKAYLEDVTKPKVRPDVWEAYQESLRQFGPLYERLAK